eukprot:121726-Prymnesium_polylepis.1
MQPACTCGVCRSTRSDVTDSLPSITDVMRTAGPCWVDGAISASCSSSSRTVSPAASCRCRRSRSISATSMRPRTSATYRLRTLRSRNARDRKAAEERVLATTIRPDTRASSLCTQVGCRRPSVDVLGGESTPGRAWSRLSGPPNGLECTPAGLLTMANDSSS